MSEQETKTLKIRKIDNGDIEETCKQLLGGKPIKEVDELADSYAEALMESQWQDRQYKYEVTPQGVYEILEHQSYEGSDVFEATKNEDGTIDVFLSYYNGGCSMGEALEIALEKSER